MQIFILQHVRRTQVTDGTGEFGSIVAAKGSGHSKGAKHVVFEGLGDGGAGFLGDGGEDAELGKTANGG